MYKILTNGIVEIQITGKMLAKATKLASSHSAASKSTFKSQTLFMRSRRRSWRRAMSERELIATMYKTLEVARTALDEKCSEELRIEAREIISDMLKLADVWVENENGRYLE